MIFHVLVGSETYWISSRSQDLVDDWEVEPGFISANQDGCIKVLRSQGVWASDQITPSAAALCESKQYANIE